VKTKKTIAIDIDINNKIFRLATRKITLFRLAEEDYCNGDLYTDYTYKPYIVTAETPTSELSFEGEASIPNIKVTVWDVQKEIRTAFNTFFDKASNYEEASVKVMLVSEDETAQHPFLVEQAIDGYMTDVSYKDGQLSFTVRVDDSSVTKDFMKLFTYDSFQTFEILPVFDIELGGEFKINEGTPWRVFKTENGSTRLRNTQRYTAGGMTYVPRADLSGGVFPGANVVVTNTITNQYKKVVFDNLTDVDTGLSYFGDPNERRLIYQDETLFPNPNGAYYHYAIMGEEHDQSIERIAYAYCMQGLVFDPVTSTIKNVVGDGASNYFLSGIPTEAYPDPIGMGTIPGFASVTAFKNACKVKYQHVGFERLAPVNFFDKIFVIANGLLPNDYVNDPELSVGFVYAGKELKANDNVAYKVFHRYVIQDVFTDIYDEEIGEGTVHPFILQLNIHSRNPDPNHTYYAGIPFGNWGLKTNIDYGEPVLLTSYNYILKSMDLNMLNSPEDVLESINDGNINQLKDRYRGKRVDMLKSFDDLLQVVGQSGNFTNQTNYSKINNDLLNNATGLFAICNSSEIIIDGNYTYERLYFYATQEQATFRNAIPVDETNNDSFDPDVNVSSVDKKEDKLFANYFTYAIKPINKTQQQSNFNSFRVDAKNYFIGQRYRVIHNPVPENSESLGKFFPIVYGNVIRVPLVHVISNKTFMDKDSTAGDDVYIFAAHQTDVKDPSGITIELFDESSNDAPKNIDSKNFSASIKEEIAISPFPPYLDNHYTFNETLRFFGRIYNPYFNVEKFITLDGDTLFGIKLRGKEWDYKANVFDRRYPIRNGVGSSPLYGTLAGWVDQDGSITGRPFSLIIHPMDILKHFLNTYGKYPANTNLLSEENMQYIKSRTRKYEASIYLTELITASEFIEKICLQFGIFSYIKGDQTKFTLAEIEIVDFSKPIAEGYNLLDDVEEETEGYKDIYTEINYRYSKNYVNDDFSKVLTLNSKNNEYCARASKVNGGKKVLDIEADFVTSDLVANAVTNRLSYFLCSRRYIYKVKVRIIEGIVFEPGDRVPLTASALGYVEEPVTVTSVKDLSNGIYELSLARFV